MALYQRRLTRMEWENMEIPVNDKEKEILQLIKNGYHNVDMSISNIVTISSYMKVEYTKDILNYIYIKYLHKCIDKLNEKYNLSYNHPITKSNKNPSKRDKIKIDNSGTLIPYYKENEKIYEFVLLDIISNILKYKHKESNKWVMYYFTLLKLKYFNITIHPYISSFCDDIINLYAHMINPTKIIMRGSELLEKNEYFTKYQFLTLYNHQKNIYTSFKHNESGKLILYTAPTATGKTLTPIGLAESYRVIFVCAARHVGLSLAKYAISANRKIALAFGCNDSEDIRLHYFSAKDVIRDKKNGTIRKVDNTVGDLVEIMICDINSYLYAMYYMLAFNDKEKCILYWDEPTITMDYNEHPYHEIIHTIWNDNLIPNIVLSSATLPKQHELNDIVVDYKNKFLGEVESIVSHDCKKTIPILDTNGNVALPHFNCKTYDDLQTSVAHCIENNTILRYMDLQAIIEFIIYIDSLNIVASPYKIENYFSDIKNITMSGIKIYYLNVLKIINQEQWEYIKEWVDGNKRNIYDSTIQFATKDAYTITDGPGIYLSNNVKKVTKVILKDINLPKHVIHNLQNNIEFNNRLKVEITKLEKNYEDGTAKDEHKENKIADLRVSDEMKLLKKQIEELYLSIKPIHIESYYIPNKKSHYERYKDMVKERNKNSLFTSDINDKIVEEIMMLNDIETHWKILLLMGIGVFTNHRSTAYKEIMKKLAEKQKLFMVVASSDYIYGTNYQFCQGYIGKDLLDMTQEKAIQAMGRVGRTNIQQQYSIRIRDDSIIRKIFLPEENKPEIYNMNRLFVTDNHDEVGLETINHYKDIQEL